jgi:ribosomal-protein-alanine acetyltransferase
MAEEFRRLVPQRRHFVVRVGAAGGWEGCPVVTLNPGSAWSLYRQLRRHFRRLRVGHAAVMFSGDKQHRALRLAAFLLAPCKILAYNGRLERHHPRLRSPVASWLFLRGVPLDRILLRPSWLCPWKRDRSVIPATHRVLEGRAPSPRRRRVAVLTPYFPYPLSHGGAVRIFNLLREAARRFDIYLFAFTEADEAADAGPVLEFCAQAILVPKPRYREPRWASLAPPLVCEYRSPTMRRLLDELRRTESIELTQVEFTQLASYDGDVLVEHDVTTDLYRQIHTSQPTLASWWDFIRWRRYEGKAVRRYRRVVAMSGKDAAMLGAPHARVIPNGVDLERYRPSPESPGQRLLFIGSFRHFPNIAAFRFFIEQVWPLLRDGFPKMTLTVVAGPEPLTYWRAACGSAAPAPDGRIRLLEFVRDVRPLYEEANLVIVPTLASAGTNVKVLEAMAMQRVVVSTSSGCAGLDLEHGKTVWVADGAEGFAAGVRRLIADADLRAEIASAARKHVERRFGWRALGAAQRELWAELLGLPAVREALPGDIAAIAAIQAASPEAAVWEPAGYLAQRCLVAEAGGRIAGFVAYRPTGEGEWEILNLAVAPEARRKGVAAALTQEMLARSAGKVFLEVRLSNTAARKLYQKLGFSEVGLRRGYYESPPEDGIVMTLQSC